MTVLRPAGLSDIPILMSWITTPDLCAVWGGPGFRYPFTQETFVEDLLLDRPSFILREDEAPVGFGQCYLREGRRHLGRLIIKSEAQGRGLGVKLIGALLQSAPEKETSLFVKHVNTRAARLYRRMGFEKAAYPGALKGFDDCDYMTAQVADVLAFCASR